MCVATIEFDDSEPEDEEEEVASSESHAMDDSEPEEEEQSIEPEKKKKKQQSRDGRISALGSLKETMKAISVAMSTHYTDAQKAGASSSSGRRRKGGSPRQVGAGGGDTPHAELKAELQRLKLVKIAAQKVAKEALAAYMDKKRELAGLKSKKRPRTQPGSEPILSEEGSDAVFGYLADTEKDIEAAVAAMDAHLTPLLTVYSSGVVRTICGWARRSKLDTRTVILAQAVFRFVGACVRRKAPVSKQLVLAIMGGLHITSLCDTNVKRSGILGDLRRALHSKYTITPDSITKMIDSIHAAYPNTPTTLSRPRVSSSTFARAMDEYTDTDLQVTMTADPELERPHKRVKKFGPQPKPKPTPSQS